MLPVVLADAPLVGVVSAAVSRTLPYLSSAADAAVSVNGGHVPDIRDLTSAALVRRATEPGANPVSKTVAVYDDSAIVGLTLHDRPLRDHEVLSVTLGAVRADPVVRTDGDGGGGLAIADVVTVVVRYAAHAVSADDALTCATAVHGALVH